MMLTDADGETLARILSFLSSRDLGVAISTAPAIRASVVEHTLAWETAIVDIDPFGELQSSQVAWSMLGRCFANGLIGFMGACTRRGGLWIQKAISSEVANETCRTSGAKCEVTQSRFAEHNLGQTISAPLSLGSGEVFHLINHFAFDSEPFMSVGSQQELVLAAACAAPFQTIAVHRSFEMEMTDPNMILVQKHLRLVGRSEDGSRPQISHRGGHGHGDEYRGTIFALLFSTLVLEHLALVSGEEPDEEDFDDWTGDYSGQFFPGIDVGEGAKLFMRDCTVEAFNGTAVILSGDGACACLKGSTLSTPATCQMGLGSFLGLVMTDGTTATVRGCTFCFNFWGMFVGKDVDDDTETGQFLMRHNTFHSNHGENISRMDNNYDYHGQSIQPWRPGWSGM